MKRFLSVFVLLIFLLTLSACQGVKDTSNTDNTGSRQEQRAVDLQATLAAIPVWLDSEGLTLQARDGDLFALWKRCSYEGTPLLEIAGIYTTEGIRSNRYGARSSHFWMGGSVSRIDEAFSHSFYTSVPLEGFAVYGGIQAGDTLAKVQQAWGWVGALPMNTTEAEAVLCRNETAAIVSSRASDGSLILVFREEASDEVGDQPVALERTVTLSFSLTDGGEHVLKDILIRIQRNPIPEDTGDFSD